MGHALTQRKMLRDALQREECQETQGKKMKTDSSKQPDWK